MKRMWKMIDVKETTISILFNSGYYFLGYVFVICGQGDYRLVVLHSGRTLLDCRYTTLKGAKVAFAKMFNRRSWKKHVNPSWSPPFRPDVDWMSEKIEIVKNNPAPSFPGWAWKKRAVTGVTAPFFHYDSLLRFRSKSKGGYSDPALF